MNISAIKLNESGLKNITLSDIANELFVLGDTQLTKFSTET
jgi:hypothetical protein